MNANMVVPKAMLVYKLHFCYEIRIIRAYIIGKLISTFKLSKPVFPNFVDKGTNPLPAFKRKTPVSGFKVCSDRNFYRSISHASISSAVAS